MTEKDMSVKDWFRERIEMYCDADRRRKADPDEVERYCPTIGEALDVMAE